MRAAYSGPADGHGHEAARRLVPDAGLTSVEDARELLLGVEAAAFDVGVVPYEDSVEGSDPVVVDHLVFTATSLYLQAELDLQVVVDDAPRTRRYVLVGTAPAAPTTDPSTLVFVVPAFNRPGTLLDILAAFSSRGINLTKIESRPLSGHLGMYGFLLEFEGSPVDPHVRDAVGDVLATRSALKYLGTFSAAERQWGEVRGREPAGSLLHTLDDLDALIDSLPQAPS